jgi:dUTP pyrophosphatase
VNVPVNVRVRLLHPAAELPRRAHPGDGGADLFAVEEVTIPPGERREVGTGIALAIPSGYAGFVQPRSGLAFRHGIMVVNSPGLIDAVTGEVRVSLYNSGKERSRSPWVSG